MSGLIESLSSAARAMQAQSYGIETTGHNMANLNTPGYARKLVHLSAIPPGQGGGVRLMGVTGQRDALVDARLRRELPAAAREAAVVDGLSVVESSIGLAGAAIDRDLAGFFDAWRALAEEPASPTARNNVVQQGQNVAQTIGGLSDRLEQSARDADRQIRSTVERINRLSADVVTVNHAIARASGVDAEALQDRLGRTLDELAGLIDIRVVRHSDNTVDVALASGHALVTGETAYGIATGNTPSGDVTLLSGDFDVTGDVTGGRLAGYRHLRDTLIPAYRAQLDQLAFDVASQVNALHQNGFDLTGAAAGDFFVAPAGVAGAARAMAVSSAIVADASRVAASSTGTRGDNGVAAALAALPGQGVAAGGATFSEAWGQMVYRVGSDAQAAKTRQQSHQDVADAVLRVRDSVSGVSLDEEVAALIKYQRAYEANAKFFAAVGQTLDMLMQII